MREVKVFTEVKKKEGRDSALPRYNNNRKLFPPLILNARRKNPQKGKRRG